jgi:hypothetical protein
MSGANMSSADMRSANMRSANMRGADMRGADIILAILFGAVGNGRELKSIQIFPEYAICYSKHIVFIGCKGRKLDSWKNFTDEDILAMDGKRSIDFWRRNKDTIIGLIESNPSEG